MSGMQRVTFSRRRAHLPRLSPPRDPNRPPAKRYWTAREDAIMRQWFPKGGLAACALRLPQHHTSKSSIYARAQLLGLNAPRSSGGGGRKKIIVPPDIDDTLRREYELQDGKKRGGIDAIADKLRLPRWWVTKRAIKLGLCMPHKKEPPWTRAEDALLRKVPLHDPLRCAKIFREHGFARSPTAIVIRCKRLHVSRRYRETLSAYAAAAIVGFDPKNFGTMLLSGECKATKRKDRRLPQQGGSRWEVKPDDLRRFILDNLDRIDLRKVEKFAFVQLISGD